MPVVFFKDAKNNIQCTGLSKESFLHFQAGTIQLSHELKQMSSANTLIINNKEGKLVRGEGFEVGIDGYGVGRFLYSDSFGPCQAVVAKLKDGDFALYHSFSSIADSPACIAFIKEIQQRGVLDVYVFQKNGEKNHKSKAAYSARGTMLTVGLLGNHLPVHRVLVDDYTSIVADANTNNICLSYSVKSMDLKSSSILSKTEEKQRVTAINVEKATISNEKTFKEIMELQKTHDITQHGPSLRIAMQKYTDALEGEPIIQYKRREKAYIIEDSQSMRFKGDTYSYSTHSVSSEKHDNQYLDKLLEFIGVEVARLSAKRTLGCFPALNAVNKVQEIESAVTRAINHFIDKPLNSKQKMLDFLGYSDGNHLSIKDALEIKRWRGATPHMYNRIVAKIDALSFTKSIYIEVKAKK